MGLLKTIKNMFRGAAAAADDKLKDAERDGKFAIQDSKKQMAEFTAKIAHLMAENRKMEKRYDNAKADVNKWQSIAIKAAANNDEAGARLALQNKNVAQKVAATMKTEIEKTESIIVNLKKQLETAKTKIGSAESNLTRLAARNEAAKIRTDLAKAATDFNSGDSPLAALDDLEKDVESQESEAEAWEELQGSAGQEADLEDKYSSAGSDVDDELAKLMGKNKL
jgi:phage shock protein A